MRNLQNQGESSPAAGLAGDACTEHRSNSSLEGQRLPLPLARLRRKDTHDSVRQRLLQARRQHDRHGRQASGRNRLRDAPPHRLRHPLSRLIAARDQWPRVWERVCAADVLVWGTPVYWHGMTGALKTLIERMNDEPAEHIAGTPLAFFFQGSGPGPAVTEVMHTTIERLTDVYRMPLLGIADGAHSIPALRQRIVGPFFAENL
ncbi:flavodoxin family protein [Actinomyces viscosus]|uniref:flavodoxin family protein n=1 Tax=Actinomyces viscosus TaxID=1656 RepID=UPI0022B292D3|nr:NAD(P)H-dependent oxidoreductase [Actinomyces viscosus]